MKNLIKEINVDEEADEILDGNEDEFEDLELKIEPDNNLLEE